VTTASAEHPAPVRDDPDEVTMVRPREEPQYVAPAVVRHEPVRVPVSGPLPPPQPASSFSPLKIIIPSAVALLVVFAAIYAFKSTGSSEANTNQQTQTLAADPNSQPVQPSQPPSGKGEEGIPVGGTITPPANVNASPNANAAVSPEALEDITPVANANANENSNTNGNSNRKAPALPEPTRSVVQPEASPPPPAPSATKTPAEKPSPTATPI